MNICQLALLLLHEWCHFQYQWYLPDSLMYKKTINDVVEAHALVYIERK